MRLAAMKHFGLLRYVRTTIGGSVAVGERKAVLDDFYTLTDSVMTLYVSRSTAMGPEAKALLGRYWREFDRLAVIALLSS